MTTQPIKWMIFATISGVLVSCSELRSPHYVGEVVEIMEEDLGRESAWVMDEELYWIRRTGSNSFVAATMEWNRKTETYEARTAPILLTQLDDHLYLQLKEDDEYIILRAACSQDESLILFTIKKDIIEKDVQEGKIRARISGNKITLECSKEEQDEYIRDNVERIFSYDCARVARKVYEEKNADRKKKH